MDMKTLTVLILSVTCVSTQLRYTIDNLLSDLNRKIVAIDREKGGHIAASFRSELQGLENNLYNLYAIADECGEDVECLSGARQTFQLIESEANKVFRKVSQLEDYGYIPTVPSLSVSIG